MASSTEPVARERWATSEMVLRVALLLTAAAYARTVVFDFVFDDHLQIAMNPWVQAWRFVPHYFTGHVWSFEQPAWAGNYYRPLFLLWLRVVNSVVGLTPGWWHLLTIAAHLLATWLVYRVGVKLVALSAGGGPGRAAVRGQPDPHRGGRLGLGNSRDAAGDLLHGLVPGVSKLA